jgi:hypothetical protein
MKPSAPDSWASRRVKRSRGGAPTAGEALRELLLHADVEVVPRAGGGEREPGEGVGDRAVVPVLRAAQHAHAEHGLGQLPLVSS